MGQCPAILIAVGLWLIYLAEAGKISTATKNTGFTLVKISTIISLAVSILGLVVAEILAIMITAAAAKYDDSAIGGGIIIMLLLLVVMGLGILMNSKTLSTLGVMVKTAQTAQPSDKISTYVAVISFLNGIGAVIGMLGFGSVPSVLSSLCNAVACICFAVSPKAPALFCCAAASNLLKITVQFWKICPKQFGCNAAGFSVYWYTQCIK